MAKKALNNAKAEKQFHRENFKIYTKATVYAISKNLEDIEFEELVEGIYLHTNDEDVNYLLKLIEKQLLLCKIDFDRFSSELHGYYLGLSDELKEKKLYKKFYKLCYYIYVAMTEKRTNQEVINAYLNFVMQLNAYLPRSSSKTPYGVSSKGTLMIRDESIKNLSKINRELALARNDRKSEKEICAIYHRNGYPEVKGMMDMMRISTNDQIITNMLFHLCYFIHEHNEHMVSLPYLMPNTHIPFSPALSPLRNMVFPQTLTKLTSRELLLPTDGILVSFGRSTSLTEVFFEESIVDDTIFLLYRFKMNDAYLSGYFDTRRELFFSPWRDTDYEKNYHEPLEFLILQMYMYLTCVLTQQEQKELYVLDRFGVDYRLKVLSGTSRKEKVTYEPYDRSKYLAELIDISPFLRHLPIGAFASDDAIKMARKLGIELPKGMTLVRGFRRKSWVKDGEKDRDKQ